MTLIFKLSLLSTLFVSPGILAADIEAGKAKAITCSACHGPEGISMNPMWPNLAGQHAPYLVKQLKAFKDGSRVDPTMSAMVQMLSDEDIENVAAYYESLK